MCVLSQKIPREIFVFLSYVILRAAVGMNKLTEKTSLVPKIQTLLLFFHSKKKKRILFFFQNFAVLVYGINIANIFEKGSGGKM